MHDIQKKILQLSEEQDLNTLGYRKLGALVGVDHPQKVKWHLQKLIRDGHLITTVDGQLTKPASNSISAHTIMLPILGRANCGEPLQFAEVEHGDSIQVSKSLLPKNKATSCFAVRAIGESMNQADIKGQPLLNGDLAVVDASIDGPEEDEFILVSIDGLATIKQWKTDRDAQRIMLNAVSSLDFNPIILGVQDEEAYTVHGKVIDVIPTAV